MKTAPALLSATAVGLAVVASGAGASAASAAPVTAACATTSDHVPSDGGEFGDNWYMDCIPQYGVGKAEFTIEAEGEEFPEGFADLDTPGVTATSTLDADAVEAYVGPDARSGFRDFSRTDSDDPTDPDYDASPSTQAYAGGVVLPITSVRSGSTAELPADCSAGDATYSGVYVLTYGTASTTFSQVVAGQTIDYRVTAAPTAPLLLALNLDPDTGDYVEDAPFCAVYGDQIVQLSELAFPGVFDATAFYSLLEEIVFTENGLTTLSPEGADVIDLGSFTRYIAPVTPPVVEPAPSAPAVAPAAIPAAQPELANTGADATLPLSLAGGGLLAAGLALVVARVVAARRRRA